jgi:transposase InsO family protein
MIERTGAHIALPAESLNAQTARFLFRNRLRPLPAPVFPHVTTMLGTQPLRQSGSPAAYFSRQCVALEADTSLASRRVTRVLDSAMREYGWPKRIRCDNGPELTSHHFLAWAVERRIELLHIQPGRPTQNGRIESFHGKST